MKRSKPPKKALKGVKQKVGLIDLEKIRNKSKVGHRRACAHRGKPGSGLARILKLSAESLEHGRTILIPKILITSSTDIPTTDTTTNDDDKNPD